MAVHNDDGIIHSFTTSKKMSPSDIVGGSITADYFSRNYLTEFNPNSGGYKHNMAPTFDTETALSLYSSLDETTKAQLIQYVASGGVEPAYDLPDVLKGVPDHVVFINAAILCGMIAQEWLDDLDRA